MRRLSSVHDLRREKDRGASAVIVAIFASTVIIGMLALTVDVGSIMYERRQLQNTADSTALAMAQICSKGTANCDPTNASTTSSLTSLLNGNSADKFSQMDKTTAYPDGVCGRNTGGSSIPTCDSAKFGVDPAYTPPSVGDLAVCPALPDALWKKPSVAYVETYTKTQTASGSSILPKFFSQALAGGSSDSTVRACSRAAWGPEGATIPTLPVVMGVCNWNQATANGTKFAPSPPYTPAPSAANTSSAVTAPNPDVNADGSGDLWPRMTQIFAHVNGSETAALAAKFPCGQDLNSQSGLAAPGGFGWVKTCKTMTSPPDACSTVTDGCLAAFMSTGTLQSDPGASMPTDCKGILPNYVGTEVEIPISTSVTGSGGSAVFTVDGISTFFIAGVSGVPGMSDVVVYNDDVDAYRNNTCIDTSKTPYKRYQSTCMWGWFTSPIKPVGTLGSGSNRGPIVITSAG